MGDFHPKLFNCCHEGFTRRVKYAFVEKAEYGFGGFLGGNTAYSTFRRVRKTICSCATPAWTSTATGVFEMEPATGGWTESWTWDPSGSQGWSCSCGSAMLWWHLVALEDDYFLFEARDAGNVVWYSEEGFLEDELAWSADWGLAALEAWDLSAQAWWSAYNLSTGSGVLVGWRDFLPGWGSYGGGTCPMASGGDGNGTFKNVGWSGDGILLPADGQYAGDFNGAAGFQAGALERSWLRVRAAIGSKAPNICTSELEGDVPTVWTAGVCTLGGSAMELPGSSLAGAGILRVRARDSKANRTGPPMPTCCNQPQ